MTKKYKVSSGFTVITHNAKETLGADKFYLDFQILTLIDNGGITRGSQYLTTTSNSDLDTLGVRVINDPGYDQNRYDLTGTPSENIQGDDSYDLDYTGALTEKSGYIEILRTKRVQECKESFNTELDTSYNFDDTVINVDLKKKKDSVLSFKVSADNIANGNTHATRVLDYNGNIIEGATTSQITAMYEELSDIYAKLLDKKFEHLKSISDADRATLDGMTTFDWTV